MIENLFDKDTIELGVEVNNWQEAIRFCGMLFVNNGNTDEQYIEAMINTAEIMKQYIVIEKGIAISHAKPEDGVKQTGIGLITLKNPIKFGHEEYDPVDILMFIGASDRTVHLKALSEIMKLANDVEFINLVRNTSSKEEILNWIEGKKLNLVSI